MHNNKGFLELRVRKRKVVAVVLVLVTAVGWKLVVDKGVWRKLAVVQTVGRKLVVYLYVCIFIFIQKAEISYPW